MSTHRIQTLVALACTFALALGAGCDDSDGTAIEVTEPGEFDSGVTAQDDSTIDTLSDDDIATFCEEVQTFTVDWVQTNRAGVCRFAGVLAAQLLAGVPEDQTMGISPSEICSEVESACGADDELFGEFSTQSSLTCGLTAESARMNCTATVAEFEACLTEVQTSLSALVGSAADTSCSNAGNAQIDLDSLAEQAMVGAACATVEQKCPGALDDLVPGDDATGGGGDSGTGTP